LEHRGASPLDDGGPRSGRSFPHRPEVVGEHQALLHQRAGRAVYRGQVSLPAGVAFGN